LQPCHSSVFLCRLGGRGASQSTARRFHQNRLPFSQILTDFSHFFAKRKQRIRSMQEDRHIFYF
jgi:hypothetical protein